MDYPFLLVYRRLTASLHWQLLPLAILLSFQSVYAQLPVQWHGVWTGTLQIYRQSALVDSVPIRLTIARTDKPNVLTWRTDYLSATRPMTKDYKLVTKDADKGIYQTDEGEGTLLTDYLFGNKLYGIFEVQDVLLTSSYELRQDELIVEVTSGKKLPDLSNGVRNYATSNLQRAVLRRQQ